MGSAPKHRISIQVGNQRVDGWTSYEITSSMIDAVDHFTLTRPFDKASWRTCVVDQEITVWIDDVAIVTGRIDDRKKRTARGESAMTVTGRDKVGRLVQESAPTIAYDGQDLFTVISKLASPWFTSVTSSNARNRFVGRGKRGRKAAAGTETVLVKVRKKTWQVEPGQTRWKIMNELASEAGYVLFASGDGQELIIGQPNYSQAIQFLISNPDPSSTLPTTALEMDLAESVADRFSLIMALGSGRGDSANYGASTVSRRDVVRNGPGIDGTGLDFIAPKRLILAERTLLNIEEAKQHAQREMNRRDFHKQIVNATMPGHGQVLSGDVPTLYTYDTLARVVDDDLDPPLDAAFLIFSCKYSGTREEQKTALELVPRGTVFAQ